MACPGMFNMISIMVSMPLPRNHIAQCIVSLCIPCSHGHCSLNHCSIASITCLKFPGFLPTASSTLCAMNFKGPSQGESEKRLSQTICPGQGNYNQKHLIPFAVTKASQPSPLCFCSVPSDEASCIHLGDGLQRHISHRKPSHSTSQSKKRLTGWKSGQENHI